ncbi:hypothetical protein CC86DRAFT_453663 [Ophiobolus disseminans]|uniref:Uncharacterized protein n=1 Tax=Ophiobolus disseminans TaxID=1469910 RepID=A0A6A7ABX6_9PLEO|nr:hypothetical protein CC86DRAFT_453663 [Ophiobolus disseminans]
MKYTMAPRHILAVLSVLPTLIESRAVFPRTPAPPAHPPWSKEAIIGLCAIVVALLCCLIKIVAPSLWLRWQTWRWNRSSSSALDTDVGVKSPPILGLGRWASSRDEVRRQQQEEYTRALRVGRGR